MNLPPEFYAHMRNMERASLNVETDEAKADPKRHKLSRVFEGKGGTNYSYWRAGKDGRNRLVLFCWSSHRNVAGYFLAWREVRGQRQHKRDQWAARKSRKAARALAERRAEAFRRTHAD